MFDQKLAEAMQRILAKGDERVSLSASVSRIVTDYGLGMVRGKSAFFTAKDRAEMRELLQARGYAITRTDLSVLSRAERLSVTPYEKAGGAPVRSDRISVKALPGRDLKLAGKALQLPPESHVNANWPTVIAEVGHSCVMLVENYENFNRIHQMVFELPEAFDDPLVIYRGDPYESRFDHVQAFLWQFARPVLAFVDLDPAGLALAAALPYFAGLVAPSVDALSTHLQAPALRRIDLFQQQYPVYGGMLDGLGDDHPVAAAWKLLKTHRAGIVQERWVQSGEPMTLLVGCCSA